MAIRVKWAGFEIELDGPEELADVISVLRRAGNGAATRVESSTESASQPAGGVGDLDLKERIALFYATLPPKPRETVTQINAGGGGVNGETLAARLRVAGGKGLAGALSGITKHAIKCGLAFDDVVSRTSGFDSKGYIDVLYSITDQLAIEIAAAS